MTKQEFCNFIKERKLAVAATVSLEYCSESALIGIAVTPALEIVFDTSGHSRKANNLRNNPSISLVIGWENETTLQCEGVADEPTGEELSRCKAAYFEAFPDGRDREKSPEITYFRVKPAWARYCSFNDDPPKILEISISEHEFVVSGSHA